ncbi:MAG: hypothetical protein IT357_12390 [Gemmatimonadaceae bacterium]|nr:hypothetical protein [Gemmatimonadaceae bacterium]
MDDQFFAELVVRLIGEPGAPARFDARPLKADPDVLAPVTASLAVPSAQVSTARSRVLARVGADTSDALLAMRCPGWTMVAMDSTLARPCPHERRRIYMVGTARQGPAAYPDGTRADLRGAVASGEMRSVRVVLMEIGPRGLAVTAFDYVYHRTGEGWRFLVKVGLYVME